MLLAIARMARKNIIKAAHHGVGRHEPIGNPTRLTGFEAQQHADHGCTLLACRQRVPPF